MKIIQKIEPLFRDNPRDTRHNISASIPAITTSTHRLITEKNRFQKSLTEYFTNSPMLRKSLSDWEYFQIESPKILLESFTITTAVTLLHLLDLPERHQQSAFNELVPLLFIWLCAAQGIQAVDALRLTQKNFVRTTPDEKAGWLQIRYFRSATGTDHAGPLIPMLSVEAKALTAYLKHCEDTSECICAQLPDKNEATPTALHQLWNQSSLSQSISRHLQERQAPDIFIRAFRAAGTPRHNQRLTLFTPSSVKNTAIRARSDRHQGKLPDQKLTASNPVINPYPMTDANKQWVNRYGRITRAVMEDIRHRVYRPINNTLPAPVSLTAYDDDTKETLAETGCLLVLDTKETVVMMLYYMSEAERQFDTLFTTSRPLLEQTIIPTSEWMFLVLQLTISPKAYQRGKQYFEQIKSHLPPLLF